MTDWSPLIEKLKTRGVEFTTALCERETVEVEERFEFSFPTDLRAFLQTAMPVGEHFPDWRKCDVAILTNWLDRPRDGVLFDVLYNNFWLSEWGERPASLSKAIAMVNGLIDAAPKLIPVYRHRMMPAEPQESGNPVFSVHQTDIIAYGVNLADYLAHEFLFGEDENDNWVAPADVRAIRFWNIERFQEVRWGEDGSCRFDNSRGLLP